MVKRQNPSLKDLKGQKFGRLTVVRRAENDKTGHVRWYCNCDCGTKDTIVYKDALLDGRQISCGCYCREVVSKRMKGIRKGNRYELDGEYGIGYTSQNKPFYFDLEDYELIKDFTWHIDYNGYVVSSRNRKIIFLHRLVMDVHDSKIEVDHIHHHLNDARKKELRIVEHIDNLKNRTKPINNTSGYAGVFKTRQGKYQVKIQKKSLGTFNNIFDAIKARRKAERELYGNFAYDYIEVDSDDIIIKYVKAIDSIETLKQFCESFPTCEGCPFKKEHIGCMFRGKTPREW